MKAPNQILFKPLFLKILLVVSLFTGTLYADAGITVLHSHFTDQSTKELFKDKATFQRRVSVAEDGFKTSYVDLTPHNFDPKTGITEVLIHGYSKDGLYWVDFAKATELLQKGHRVIMPDLMGRGQTMELNFPLDAKGEWHPTDAQKEILDHMTLKTEAKYLHEMLANDYPQSQGRLIISGHSRGGGVSANLQLLLARENLMVYEKGFIPPWNVSGHWGFNTFVAYTTAAFPGIKTVHKDIYSDPGNISASRKEKKIYDAYAEMIRLEETIGSISNKVIDSDLMTSEDVQKYMDIHKQLVSRIPEIIGHYTSTFEGLGEYMFIEHLMENFADQQEVLGNNKYSNRGLWAREKDLLEAMMKGLRVRYNIDVNSQGRPSAKTTKIMIPDSVIGVYAELLSRNYPGISQNYHIVQGALDEVVPLKLLQHLVASSNEVNRGALKIHVVKDTGHYGPEYPEVQTLFKQNLNSGSGQNQCHSFYLRRRS